MPALAPARKDPKPHAMSQQKKYTGPKPPPPRNLPLVLGLVGFTGIMCSVPLLLQKRHARLTGSAGGLTTGERPLTVNEQRRGVYLNTGSKDVGPDPDWDWKKGTYKGQAPAIVDETTGLAPSGSRSMRAAARKREE